MGAHPFDPIQPGNVADDLMSRSEWMKAEAQRLREDADALTVKAAEKRRSADAIELEAVEAYTAANIIRQTGLRVDRDPAGLPRVTVDPKAAPVEVPV